MIFLLMAILSAQQIYNLAIEAGFSPQDATQATAIALAESGGNTTIVNGIGAMGLMQIYDGNLPNSSRIAQMSDPLANMKAAYAKFVASQHTVCGGWWPWASYNEGPCHNSDPNRNNTWRSFLNIAQTASGTGNTSGTEDAGGILGSGAALITAQSQTSSEADNSAAPTLFGNAALGKIVSRLSSPGFYWSVGFTVLAGMMIILGLIIYFRKDIEATAGKAIAAA